jgi:microsomal epoxide hydrolase
MSQSRPFEVRWSEAEIETVLAQVRSYPWPPAPAVPDGWAYGCDGAYLKDLCEHWTQRYDWRAAMADLNRFPSSPRGSRISTSTFCTWLARRAASGR